MKNKILSSSEVNKVIARAIEIVFTMQHDMCLRPSQISLACSYSPWRGLGETSIYQTGKVAAAFEAVDRGFAQADAAVTALESACEKDDSPAHDPRRLLVKTPGLIPYFLAMAELEKWNFKAVLLDRSIKDIPPLIEKNTLQDVPTKNLVFQPPRIDLAVEAMLGARLSNPVNVTNWRIYSSLIGVRLFAAMPAEQRKQILAEETISGFAFARYTVEKQDREAREAASQAREEAAARKKLEKEQKENQNKEKSL